MTIGRVLLRVLTSAVLALAGCGGESKDPPRFTWADLQGTWDRIFIHTNEAAGWVVHELDVDAYGNVTFVSCENAFGACTPTGTLRYEIDASGNVTASGTAANPTLVGTMSAAKDLIFATASTLNAGAPDAFQLQVFRKRDPGVTWSSADVADRSFVFHNLRTGTPTVWERGVGTTDVDGAVTIVSGESSSGSYTLPPAGSNAFIVSDKGLVTRATDLTYRGIMTADKQAIFSVRGSSGSFAFGVWLATAPDFKQADLAGSWSYKMLVSGPDVNGSNWGRGTFTVDGVGNLTFQSVVNAQGTPGTTGWTLQLAPDGALTRADYPTYRGQLDSGKRLFVRTQTQSGGAGPPSLSISAR